MYARRPPKMALLRIKKWEPHHEAIVVAFLGGASLSEIAESSGYSYGWVSCLLKTPEAMEKIEKVRANTKKEVEGTINSRLKALQEKALQRVENFIENDNYATSSPFAFFDRAIKVAQGTGLMAHAGPNINVTNNTQNNTINNTQVSSEQAEQLIAAFEGIKEVRRLHTGPMPANVG